MTSDKLQPKASPHNRRARKAGDPLRVLVIDDDRDTAISIKEAVEELGDAATVGFNGNEAVALTLSDEPDVLLLDLSLPDIDGLKVAETLRKVIESSALKIVAVTGLGDAEVRQKTAAAGFDLHLTKPVRFEVLESMLELLRSAPVALLG
jgi:CheY-like chemotaxis protein